MCVSSNRMMNHACLGSVNASSQPMMPAWLSCYYSGRRKKCLFLCCTVQIREAALSSPCTWLGMLDLEDRVIADLAIVCYHMPCSSTSSQPMHAGLAFLLLWWTWRKKPKRSRFLLKQQQHSAAKVLKPRKNKWALVDLLDLISLKNLQIKGKNDFNYVHASKVWRFTYIKNLHFPSFTV